MADVAYGLGMWRRLAGARTRSQVQYRTSFTLLCLASLAGPLVDLAVLLVVFANTPVLGGWTRAEVVLLYAVTGFAFWTGDAVVGATETLSERIKDGSFDAYLLRPVPSLVHVCGDAFAVRRFVRTGFGVVLVPVVASRAGVSWTPLRLAVLAGAVVTGLLVFSSVWVVTSAVAFWLVDARELGAAFTYGGGYLASQPLDIYAGWLRRFATYVLPIAFAVYLPVAYVLGKPTAGLPRGLVWACPAVALAATLVAAAVWRRGVRHYQSTGS